jgi:predicted transcriptional regulator
MDTSIIEKKLISEIKLTSVQAKTFLLITCYGKMNVSQIAEKLNISKDLALKSAKDLMALGAFIDMSETEFEAMHPRFTAVNMYRRLCEREKIEFKRNKIVDSIGVVLEKPYEDARTK